MYTDLIQKKDLIQMDIKSLEEIKSRIRHKLCGSFDENQMDLWQFFTDISGVIESKERK